MRPAASVALSTRSESGSGSRSSELRTSESAFFCSCIWFVMYLTFVRALSYADLSTKLSTGSKIFLDVNIVATFFTKISSDACTSLGGLIAIEAKSVATHPNNF